MKLNLATISESNKVIFKKNIGAADLASITEENVLEKFIHFN